MNQLTEEIEHIFTTRKIPSDNLSGQLSGTATIRIEKAGSVANLYNLLGAIQEIYGTIIQHCIETHAYYLSVRGLGADDMERYYSALNRYRELKLNELGVKKIECRGHGVIEVSGLEAIVRHIEETISAYSLSPKENLDQKRVVLEQHRNEMKLSDQAAHRLQQAEKAIIDLFS